RSAGIDAATKRRVDRVRGDKTLDEEDKAAARVMLGKKKKPKSTPFYAQGWFTILMLSMIAILAVVGFYWVFLRTESAEALFAQASAQLRAASEEERKAGRETASLFLRHYPQHEKASRVQELADKFDYETLDKQMHNRRSSALRFSQSNEELS